MPDRLRRDTGETRTVLAQPVFDRLFEGCAIERYSDGQHLFLQDDPSDRLFGIVSGRVEISIFSAGGRKLVANIETAGSLVGEIGAIDGMNRTASATAIGDCDLLCLPRPLLLERLGSDGTLALAMMSALCARLRWVSAEFGDQALMSTEQRLAKRLLFLHGLIADDDGWIEISQADLAEFLGTTREFVNKTVSGWARARFVGKRRNAVRVLDAEALKRRASIRI